MASDSKPESMTFEWYTGTPEGDRLTTLAAGYRMTFREKILWSEQCAAIARRNARRSFQTLRNAMATFCGPPLPPTTPPRAP